MFSKFVAHDSRRQFGSLIHVHGGTLNPHWPVAEPLMPMIYFRFRCIVDIAGLVAGTFRSQMTQTGSAPVDIARGTNKMGPRVLAG